ncbi:probable protein arginine N-methyltransferase 6.2 isoform X2 [Ischnura elegans]|uniref:probable protein arginine N-methyltransferase 6.2 isoform X2 n=1 Tax=Ischnura elegans TaxID=197161 RepID=UPI001ED8AB07|nr:probable protein arginine N-methyltransferase 6.2 isoform X2 [Ischnura elegans]
MSLSKSGVEHEKYFSSYEDIQVHRVMLSDKRRLDAYRDAILSSEGAFRGKVVMDVGAGTGILSMYCARAGAMKVYAVEASNLAPLASEVIKENEYSGVIQVLHQRVEDVCLPGDEKVDVIVSEWMGFYLLHESMLDSVIFARDKFLKRGGKLFPERAVLYAAPCSSPKSLVAEMQKDKEFWADVSGFKMNSIFRVISEERLKTPEVSTCVLESDLLSSGTELFSLDLCKVTAAELDLLEAKKFVSVDCNGGESGEVSTDYSGLCLWFDVHFPVNDIVLSTSPLHPPTHWKQTLVLWPPRSDPWVPQWSVESGEVVGFEEIDRGDEEGEVTVVPDPVDD